MDSPSESVSTPKSDEFDLGMNLLAELVKKNKETTPEQNEEQ